MQEPGRRPPPVCGWPVRWGVEQRPGRPRGQSTRFRTTTTNTRPCRGHASFQAGHSSTSNPSLLKLGRVIEKYASSAIFQEGLSPSLSPSRGHAGTVTPTQGLRGRSSSKLSTAPEPLRLPPSPARRCCVKTRASGPGYWPRSLSDLDVFHDATLRCTEASGGD